MKEAFASMGIGVLLVAIGVGIGMLTGHGPFAVVVNRRWRGGPCGDSIGTNSEVRRPEQLQLGPWWKRAWCRLFCHQLACCPNHTRFVWWEGRMHGLVCERCGALVGNR